MLKKIVFSTLFIGLIGILVAGAAVRTLDRTERVAEAQGDGYGRSNGEVDEYAAGSSSQGRGGYGQSNGEVSVEVAGGSGQGRGGYGRSNGEVDEYAAGSSSQGRGGYGQSNGEVDEYAAGSSSQGRGGYGDQGNAGGSVAERQYPNYEGFPPAEWLVYEGAVVQVPEDGVDLVIETGDGEKLTVGTGPMYMASQGFTLQAGELVQVRGYWEDGEFKAAQVTRLADGQTIALRNELGRPAWAGAGRNAQNNNQGGYGGQSSAQPRRKN